MTVAGERTLTIIIPSFNDLRILRAIRSVREFDDVGVVAIVVVDGGSRPEVIAAIAGSLSAQDVLISGPDRGIFDGLNKGLQAVQTPFIGWIGSDDLFSGEVRASMVIDRLEHHDLFVANTVHFVDGKVTRVTHSWPSRLRLARYGLNNPHFSTFGRSDLLMRERFSLGLRGSDIEYFLKVFRRVPRVTTSSKVCTLMEEGGFSNSSFRSIVKTNLELYNVYRANGSAIGAAFAIAMKLGYKACSAALFKVVPRKSVSTARILSI